MSKKKHIYDDDDGRTIADMSDISRPNLYTVRTAWNLKRQNTDEKITADPNLDQQLSPSERRMFILGALKAALLIALAFIVGLGLVIFLLLMFWK